MQSNNTKTLVKSLGTLMGVISFGVNGPFFFERFGLYLPIAVATAAVIGAAVGCSAAGMLYWLSHREHALTPVPAIRIKPHQHAA
ncbi:MAG TPA: hypothetical protein VKT49_04310 [Bryobacteraceae bacterium]|nr:hypothetical protein [Bryobacteraceae bacterium]